MGAGFFVVWHDTVYVPSRQQLKILKFDTNGKYITDKRYANAKDFPSSFWKTRNFVTGISFTPLPSEGNAVFKRNLNLFNDQFDKLRSYREDRVDFQNPVFDLNFVGNPCVAVSSDSLVYLPRYSENDYIIDVFDFEGNKKQVIRKKYRSLIKQYHPDFLGKGQNQDDIKKATKKVQEINQAYETIKKERSI
ncbi:MAG: DnaJ domain-containing protein [Candidatus Delongbacteria bacterium]|nr:DnaJ domain-containing protein [Candidatus Delongbacteria bacterium]